ncbi:MAG: (d)CMP kinase [Kiritimatiellae bacterium]|nr:(d)CMP kinase [Kiritimatiellia bacterium]
MECVALLGLGLMGGSVGLALKQGKASLKVRAYARREETRAAALRLGMADEVFDDPAEAVQGADLVIVCVPVCKIPELIAAAKPGLKSGAVVTDVGSTKAWLANEVREVLAGSDVVFVGSHPMCGSEKTGLEAACAGLYNKAVCIVCSDAESRSVAWKVTHFWSGLGARVVEMDAVKHDEIAAATSHVPHLTATAAVLATRGEVADLRDLIGPGFRDTTRVAAGSPEIWRDIVQSNADAVLKGLKSVLDAVQEMVGVLEAGDFAGVERLLARGAERRKALCDCADPKTVEAPARVVAIDGPSASGKSTVARGVAKALGALYVDSGAMYRGMTWKVLRAGVDPENEEAVREVMRDSTWSFETVDGAVRFTIDGEDPGEEIRGEAVRDTVSYVARIPEVRTFIVDRIRGMRGMGKLVVEGRDIGTVVFPDTAWKFYLDADPDERARRRNAELIATESGTSVEAVLANLKMRDHIDSTRKTAPLQVAPGAVVVDTTHLTLEQVVEQILGRIRES